jgi:hypothetical protein
LRPSTESGASEWVGCRQTVRGTCTHRHTHTHAHTHTCLVAMVAFAATGVVFVLTALVVGRLSSLPCVPCRCVPCLPCAMQSCQRLPGRERNAGAWLGSGGFEGGVGEGGGWFEGRGVLAKCIRNAEFASQMSGRKPSMPVMVAPRNRCLALGRDPCWRLPLPSACLGSNFLAWVAL